MSNLAVCVVLCSLVLCSCNGTSQQEQDELQRKQDSIARYNDSVAQASKLDGEGIDTSSFTVTDSTIQIKSDTYPTPAGRVVNLLVTGIDARLGEHSGRADANHVVRFYLDSGCIEVISIPRGTIADANKFLSRNEFNAN